MKKLLFFSIVTMTIISFAGISGAALVYDNTTNSTSQGLDIGDGYETADLITLGGTERVVTDFITYVDAAETGTADTQVRFYSDNGLPDSLLWDSGIINDYSYSPGTNYLIFSVPNVLVPDTFWWSIQLSDVSLSTLALLYIYDPPTIGSSEDFFAYYDASWGLYSFGGSPVANFAATVYAEPVPEPATMLLLGTGLAGVAGAARRKKKNQA